MRYDKTVYFIKRGEKVYNPDTGNYTEGADIKIKRIASVSSMNSDTMDFLFDKLEIGALTIRIKTKLFDDFDYIECEGQAYNVKQAKIFRQEAVYHAVVRQ